MWGWIAKLAAVVFIFWMIYHAGEKSSDADWQVKYNKLDKEYTDFRGETELQAVKAKGDYGTMEAGFAASAKSSKELFDEKRSKDAAAIKLHRAQRVQDLDTIRTQFATIDSLTKVRSGALCEAGNAGDEELINRMARLDEQFLERIYTPNQEIKLFAQRCNKRLMEIEKIRLQNLPN